MDKEFQISVRSRFAELWRYNMVLTCGCFNTDGEQVDFLSQESIVAAVGANLSAPPDGATRRREMCVTTPRCNNIVLYIYLIPHTLPSSRDVDEYAPFDVDISIEAENTVIYHHAHKVNQWSGASIELKLPQAK